MKVLSRLLRMLLAIVPGNVLSEAGFLDARRMARESHVPPGPMDDREKIRWQLRWFIESISEDALMRSEILDLRRARVMDDELRRLLCAVTDGAIRDTDRCRKILHDYEVAYEAQREILSADRGRLIEAEHAFHDGWGGTKSFD